MTSEDQQHVTIDATEAEKPRSPKIFADIASSFTYASYQNAIPVLRQIGVDNRSDRQIESLRLELSSASARVAGYRRISPSLHGNWMPRR